MKKTDNTWLLQIDIPTLNKTNQTKVSFDVYVPFLFADVFAAADFEKTPSLSPYVRRYVVCDVTCNIRVMCVCV